MEHGAKSKNSEVRSQRTDYRWFKVLNIEPQNKEPQNDEVITSTFDIPCSIFCGSRYCLPTYGSQNPVDKRHRA
jgi:hypothetical protein